MKSSVFTVFTLASCCAALALVGCESPSTQRQTGMIVGGVLGGVLGSQVGGGDGRTAATIGGAIGRSMDDGDRLKTAHTLETERSGVPARWVNPDSGNQYAVVPTRTCDTPAGPCREYTVDATIGGRPEKVYGTAYRQPDGSWRVVK